MTWQNVLSPTWQSLEIWRSHAEIQRGSQFHLYRCLTPPGSAERSEFVLAKFIWRPSVSCEMDVLLLDSHCLSAVSFLHRWDGCRLFLLSDSSPASSGLQHQGCRHHQSLENTRIPCSEMHFARCKQLFFIYYLVFPQSYKYNSVLFNILNWL